MSIVSTSADAAPVLARYPTASRGAVAFAARGEIWVTAREGGEARQVTRGSGYAFAARFSPDGRWIAYTRRMEGGQDVWAVPTAGGPARRLTHDAQGSSSGNLVVGWTPDGSKILFLSTRQAVANKQIQAFTVSLDGDLVERLPLNQSGLLDISPSDGRIAYTPTFTENMMRKRYLGGMAEDIFVYDPKTRRQEQVTHWNGTDSFPMWTPGALYFLSDRGKNFRLNIWRHDLATGVERQVTHFTDYDVDWPSLGGDRIVFQQGGRLWALDLANEQAKALRVNVTDDGALTTPRTMEVGFQIRGSDVGGDVNYAITPDGAAALVAAHGDIFRVSGNGGRSSDLTISPARDDDHPAVSSDGRSIAYVTEAGGAGQIAVRPAQGGPERIVTRFTDAVPNTPIFSPNGDELAVSDAQHRLWLVAIGSGQTVLVARDALADIRDAAFSPDGRWLAYSTTRASGLRAIHLYRIADHHEMIVSGELDGDRLPVFSTNGRELYFVSQRHDDLATGDRGDEASLASIASDGIYGASIGDDPATLMRRVQEVPVAPGQILSLAVRGNALFYERRPLARVGGELPGGGELHRIVSNRDEVVLRDFDSQIVSADGLHLLYRRHDQLRTAAISGADHVLDVSTMRMRVDPRAEWRAMVDQAWRLDRDLFFSRVMNGSDWSAVHAAYARLVPLVASRSDAQYLVAQIQGELATSHSFMGGLDADVPTPMGPTPKLGADLALDPASGRYRFVHVFRGDASRPRFRAPLNDPAVGTSVNDGDYLLAIDGQPLSAPIDPDALLAGKTGTIELDIAATPGGPPSEVKATLLASDLELRRFDWIEANRARVAALSKGRIGYVFLADFSTGGARDLARQLQGQLDRDGLIIDLRWNGGGYLSQAVLNLLRRTRAGVFVNRDRNPSSLPLVVAPPALAVIVNAQSASDGDQFPFFFKRDHLGTVVGQRTWGGVQGIKGPWPLIDGTTITIPKDSLAVDGHWVIENEGVEPDVGVDPAPDEIVRGRDAMLEAAVRAVLARPVGLNGRQPVPSPLPAYPPAGDVPGPRF